VYNEKRKRGIIMAENENIPEDQGIDVDKLLDEQSHNVRAKFVKADKKKYLDLNMSWIMLIVLGLATFGIAYALQQSPQANLGSGYIILFVIASYIASLIIYNLGKLLFGYISGYTLSRLEILGLQIVAADGKLKARYIIKNFFELHMNLMPRSKEEEPKPTLMLLGGTIMYAIFTVVIIVVSFLGIPFYLTLCLRYGLAIGALLVFYEMFPCKLDVPNDMYLLLITNGQDNKKAFNNILRNNNAEYAGLPIDAIEFSSYDGSRITPQTLLFRLRSQVYSNDYQEALKTVELMNNLKLNVPSCQQVEAMYEKIYLYLTHGRSTEAAKEILVLQHLEKNTSDITASISSLRCDILISALLDNSLDELNSSMENFIKEAKFIGDNPRTQKEIELVKAEITRIKNVHSDWTLGELKIDF